MIRKYKTQSNALQFDIDNNIVHGELYDLDKEPSLTVPDQAFTVKEILERFTRGGEVKMLQPQYLQDELDNPIPEGFNVDLNTMDKMEKLELLDKVQAQTKQIQLSMQKAEKAKAKAKAIPKTEPPKTEEPKK